MNVRPEDLFRWVGDPISGPMPFVMLTDGWIEASEATARVHETISYQSDLTPLIEFNTDLLLDQRARRPMMNLIDGLMQPLEWPELVISIGSDRRDQPFLYMHGPEPDFNWRPFASAVATALECISVSAMFTLGAYPVPTPHSRPVRISCTSTCVRLLAGRNKTDGTLTVPVGVQMAISEELLANGVHTLGLFAQVPYYIAATPWPQASVDLLATLADASGLEFDTAMLESQIPDAIASVDSMLDDAPALASVVDDLEQRYDELAMIQESELPNGDQLEEELQQFLRDQDDD